mmetsp:Transcript_8907/g.25562  ORF Transcript_8907/g.25562 Transcript_8907/m.25562 type:complete len:210 (+) Transcript_8907:526-1155(+)
MAGESPAHGGGQGRGVQSHHRDQHGRDQGADSLLPERPGRCEAAIGGRRCEDRRGLYWLLHDQHRPLPRGWQDADAVRGPDPHPLVDRAPDEDGPGAAHEGGLLRHLRESRRAHGDARLLPLHGQPGPRRGRLHRRLHLHTELPEPLGQGRERLLGLRGALRRGGRHWQTPDAGGVPEVLHRARQGPGEHLQVPQLRPARELPGGGGRG